MQVKEYYLDRSDTGRLYVKQWFPGTDMHAIIVMVHGIGEHTGCYEQWAERFTSQSIGFISFDLRGHGHSSGKRGHASINSIHGDLKTILKHIRKRHPKLPVILYGHSMGGHIAMSYAIDTDTKVQGIIASSPWLKLVHPPSAILVSLAKIGACVAPSLTIKTGIKAEQLTTGGSGTRSSTTDPLMHKRISIKLFTDLWYNSDNILRNKHRLNVPLLLMHGSADQLTSCLASKAYAYHAGEFTEYKQWKDMGHNLLTDSNNEAVFRYVLAWISRLAKNNGTIQNNSKMYRVA